MTRVLWICLGWLCVALGIIGTVLPLMPTVVFLIIAAFAFSKSSPRFHDWLINHPKLGPPLTDWFERGAISPRSKAMACIMIAASVLLTILLGVPLWVIAVQTTVLMTVVAFILTRPSH